MRLTRKDFLAGLASVGGLAGCRTAETPSAQEDDTLDAWQRETDEARPQRLRPAGGPKGMLLLVR